jgi:hypothetical protein
MRPKELSAPAFLVDKMWSESEPDLVVDHSFGWLLRMGPLLLLGNEGEELPARRLLDPAREL